MWDIVWVSPQGHRSVSVSRHFLLQAPQCPCSVRKRFSRDHCCRGRSKPGCRIVGSVQCQPMTFVDLAEFVAANYARKTTARYVSPWDRNLTYVVRTCEQQLNWPALCGTHSSGCRICHTNTEHYGPSHSHCQQPDIDVLRQQNKLNE